MERVTSPVTTSWSMPAGTCRGESLVFVQPFEYLRAHSVEEACAILAERGEGAKVLAGGQSLMPMINLGLVHVDALVDISAIGGLDGVTSSDGAVRLGALARHR